MNATLYTVSNGIIEGGTLVFENGRITAVGKDVPIPPNALQIDCTGKRIYPAFITTFAQLGLVEIDAVRATRDVAEVGDFNPNVVAATAYNAESEIIPTVRSNGILVAHVVPLGGLVTGRSSVMYLDGWNNEEATLRKVAGVVVAFPSLSPRQQRWERRPAEERRREQEERLRKLYDFFEQARSYARTAATGSIRLRDLRFEAMRAVFQDSLPVFILADEYQQLREAERFARHFGIRVILVGAADAWRLLEEIRAADIPVILRRIHRLPRRDDEPYDIAYRLPALLEQAGIRFAIAEEHSWPQRNLPHNLGTAIAFGLSPETALRTVTLWAAEILGLADRLGSLDAGKEATLIVCSGDPFDVRTNRVEFAFIRGRSVDLTSRHTRLAEKYRQRYRR
ncbi:MAG: amidohydrolase family protein [Bacteroidota bacterium]|nr:amidohydrolase family protein [Bacteroidota bacterium]